MRLPRTYKQQLFWKFIAMTTAILVIGMYLFSFTSTSLRRHLVSMKQTIRFMSAPNDVQEVRHIGFLKVHKAASSTMQNIFFRFGLRRNLSFVFTTNPNYFSKRYNDSFPLVPPTKRDGYDIMCIHGIFNEELYAKVLPADSVYIGIVRDPVTVFVPSVNYYSQKDQSLTYLQLTPGNKLRTLIENPGKYDKKFFSYTKNVMARDFGFNATLDPATVQNRLQKLDQKFRLVLIAEYFDESLVLMRRYLQWKMKDILYIPTNVFSKKVWSMLDMNETHVNLLQDRNHLDFKLYNFFYKRFWKRFSLEGDDIHNEVLRLKEVLKVVKTFCHRLLEPEKDLQNATKGATTGRFEEIITIDKSPWNERFILNSRDCVFMTTDELKFIKILRRLQGSVINETLY